MFKLLARPIMSMTSGTFEVVDTKPLSKDEQETGTFAFAAYFYQHWDEVDAKMLVAMWIIAVSEPRALEYFKKHKEEKEAKKGQPTP